MVLGTRCNEGQLGSYRRVLTDAIPARPVRGCAAFHGRVVFSRPSNTGKRAPDSTSGDFSTG